MEYSNRTLQRKIAEDDAKLNQRMQVNAKLKMSTDAIVGKKYDPYTYVYDCLSVCMSIRLFLSMSISLFACTVFVCVCALTCE